MNTISNTEHQQQMAELKSQVDERINEAKAKKGLILVLTGDGKGKSSSAFGMLARALGHRMRCGVVQFIKGQFQTGEERFFRQFPEQVEYHVMGEGYTWETQSRERDVAAAERAWAVARTMLQNPALELVIFDELNIVLALEYLALDEVLADLAKRPPRQHVIITGRNAPAGLIAVADTASEIKAVKHAFDAGIQAQKGIEL